MRDAKIAARNEELVREKVYNAFFKELDQMESQPVNNNSSEERRADSEDPVEHNYCCNFFLHFAIPMILYFICLCITLSVGWSFAF